VIRARCKDIEGLTYWWAGRSAGATRTRLVHLLPIYDEYLVAYRDHQAVPRGPASSGVFQCALTIDGQVAGTWRPVRQSRGVSVQLSPARRLSERERRAVKDAVGRYERFAAANVETGAERAGR